MPARRTAVAPRAVLAAALLAALAPGCSGAPTAPAAPVSSLCAPGALDACERRIGATPAGPDARALVAAYAEARAARDAADPWAKLFHDLDKADRGRHPKAVIVVAMSDMNARVTVDGTLQLATAGSTRDVNLVVAMPLPGPGAIGPTDLLLAMAGACGYDHVVFVDDRGATQLFPGDPLAPFVGGLRPSLRVGAPAHLVADLGVEEALRAAFTAAGAFQYVDAARATEKLSTLLDAGATSPEMALRGRYALQLLGQAGLVLDAPEATPAGDALALPAEAGAAPAPGAASTPYAAYLRVVTAKDPRKEWEARSREVLPGVPEARREDFAALFARPRDCDARRAPPMESARDSIFASRLSGALPRDLAAPPAAGQLSLEEWLARYQAMVGFVEATHTGWYNVQSLLYQRGEARGLSASGSPLYKRVTELGLAHLAAMKALLDAYPARYRVAAQIGLATSPGLYADDKLREALIRIVEGTVQARIAAAKDAEGLLGALFTGAIAGVSYPPALQEPHSVALAGAATARLKGDFLEKTGWGVALLYALDAVYRLATGEAPNMAFSSSQIARALAAPTVEHPALASLATAAARYAALAVDHKLDPTLAPGRFPEERRAAWDGLRAALAGLGAPGEAPAGVLDDVTTLTDGLVATLSSALASSAHRPPPKPGACTAKAPALPLDPTTRRTLAKLGDVRRRILLGPHYRKGDGLWVRRVRLLVTVLSDAMDLASGSDAGKRAAFTVPAADAEKAIEDALRELDQKAVTEALVGGYGLFREAAAQGGPEQILRKGGKDLRRVADGLSALFKSDALGGKGPTMGVALLDAIASMRFDASSGDDLLATLASYAGALYDKKQDDQADLCLLACTVLSSLLHVDPPAAAVALASRATSRVAWLMRFSQETHKRLPDPSAYAEGMRKATDDACQAPDAEATIAVMQAIHDFATGKRQEARAALDRVLSDADAKGLGVPRMVYRYEEKTATKVFTLTIDLSYGGGLLQNGNTFQLGLGVRSGGEPDSALTATLSPLDTTKSGEDTAHYYVYTAALATVYHLIEGDTDRAVAAGRRAIAALTGGVKLGTRAIRSDRPAGWGDEARPVLVLAAQLAAEAGMPLFAGDLWTVVRQGLDDKLDDKDIAALLDRVPLGVAGVPELTAAAKRAKHALVVLADPLPCTTAKVERGGFEAASCADYPLALSLRVADVLEKLPRMRHGAEPGAHCGPLRALDTFLAGADRGAYDPDAFTRAEEALRADGKIYESAVLLARLKHPGQCDPTIVGAARTLGRSPLLGPSLRADLLGVAVNCTAMTGGPDVAADVVAVDAETRKLPDPTRNLRTVLSIADLASRTDRWGLLAKIVAEPDFLGRWMNVHPNAATAALLLDHAVAAIQGQPVALDRTRASYELLCVTFKSPERADLCGTIEALRAPLRGPMEERQRIARDAVKKLVAGVSAPAAGGGQGKRP